MILAFILLALQLSPDRLDQDLFLASRNGDAELIEALLKSGARVDARHELTGWTPLITASFYGHLDAVKVLLPAGANANAADRNGGTPLMKAVQMPGGDEGMVQRKSEIVRLLLGAGADPQKKDRLGGTAWEAAMLSEEQALVEVFAAAGVRGVRETQLMSAIARRDAATVNNLIAAGADVNYREEQGWNALSEAVLAGDPAVLHAVLKAGADPNMRFEKGWTALMIAAMNNNNACLRELLAAGADPSLRSDTGQSALDLATISGNTEAVRLLTNENTGDTEN